MNITTKIKVNRSLPPIIDITSSLSSSSSSSSSSKREKQKDCHGNSNNNHNSASTASNSSPVIASTRHHSRYVLEALRQSYVEQQQKHRWSGGGGSSVNNDNNNNNNNGGGSENFQSARQRRSNHHEGDESDDVMLLSDNNEEDGDDDRSGDGDEDEDEITVLRVKSSSPSPSPSPSSSTNSKNQNRNSTSSNSSGGGDYNYGGMSGMSGMGGSGSGGKQQRNSNNRISLSQMYLNRKSNEYMLSSHHSQHRRNNSMCDSGSVDQNGASPSSNGGSSANGGGGGSGGKKMKRTSLKALKSSRMNQLLMVYDRSRSHSAGQLFQHGDTSGSNGGGDNGIGMGTQKLIVRNYARQSNGKHRPRVNLGTMPEELLFVIFTWLEPEDIGRVGSVNVLWNHVSMLDILWQPIAYCYYPDETSRAVSVKLEMSNCLLSVKRGPSISSSYEETVQRSSMDGSTLSNNSSSGSSSNSSSSTSIATTSMTPITAATDSPNSTTVTNAGVNMGTTGNASNNNASNGGTPTKRPSLLQSLFTRSNNSGGSPSSSSSSSGGSQINYSGSGGSSSSSGNSNGSGSGSGGSSVLNGALQLQQQQQQFDVIDFARLSSSSTFFRDIFVELYKNDIQLLKTGLWVNETWKPKKSPWKRDDYEFVHDKLSRTGESRTSISPTTMNELGGDLTEATNNFFSMNTQVPIKVVVVGDGSVGKTSLLCRYSNNYFPEEDFLPTIFDNFTTSTTYKNQTFNVSLYDTAGTEDYDRLRPLSYIGADIFLLCVDLVNAHSLENGAKKWLEELNKHAPGVPIVLCGTKMDLRIDKKYLTIARRKNVQVAPISFRMGCDVAKKIGAVAYTETSALTGHGVDRAFACVMRYGCEFFVAQQKHYSRSNNCGIS